MITNNFKKAVQLLMTSKYSDFVNNMNLVDVNGNNKSLKYIHDSYFDFYRFPANMRIFRKINRLENGIFFGNGEKQVSENDYRLNGAILNDKLECMATVTAENDGDVRKIVGVYTLRNTSDSEITIREIGLVGYTSDYNTSVYLLIDRTLLDEPLTLAAGETGEITYTIENTLQHSTATAQ